MKPILLLTAAALLLGAPHASLAQDAADAPRTEKKAPARDAKNAQPAPAAKEAAQAVSAPSAAEARKIDATPLYGEWKKAEDDLTAKLSRRDKETFNILYNKHSFIQVIGVVDGEIGTAVKACGAANKDLKPKIDGRYKQWQDAVLPIVKTARRQLDKDIDAQKSVDPDKFRALAKLRDRAYDEGNARIVKKPVTTRDACEGLIASMDRTEDEMITILQETLLPESVIRAQGRAAAPPSSPAPAPAPAGNIKKD